MKKAIIKSLAATSAVAVFGMAVLPLTSYAADTVFYGTTDVQVSLLTECIAGGGDGEVEPGDPLETALLQVIGLTATTPTGEASSTAGEHIKITCNDETWVLTEEINDTYSVNLEASGDVAGNTDEFTPWTAGTTVGAFAANTWGMKYTEVAAKAGNAIDAGASIYHAVPAYGSPADIAEGVAVSGYEITQTFGVNTDGSLTADTYSSQILYTLTGTSS